MAMSDVNQPLWTKNYILLSLSGLVMAMAFYFLIPTLPLYLVEELGGDKSLAGLIIGVFTFSALLIRPFTGFVIDRFGRKWVLISAALGFSLIYSFHLGITTIFGLLMVRFVHGFAWGTVSTTSSTFVVDLIPPKRRGEGIGYFGLAMPLAMAVGPLLGLTLMRSSGYEGMFLWGAVFCMLAFSMLLFIKYPVFRSHTNSFSFKRLISTKTLPVSLIMLMVMLSYGGMISYITLYAVEIGIDRPGLFFTIYAVGLASSRIFSGKIFDRHGPRYLAPVGLLMVAAGMAALALVQSATGFVLSSALIGIGFGVIFPVMQAMANNVVVSGERGAANSTLFTALDLGIGTGAILTGFLNSLMSLADCFVLLAIVVGVSAVIFPLFVYPHYVKNEINVK